MMMKKMEAMEMESFWPGGSNPKMRRSDPVTHVPAWNYSIKKDNCQGVNPIVHVIHVHGDTWYMVVIHVVTSENRKYTDTSNTSNLEKFLSSTWIGFFSPLYCLSKWFTKSFAVSLLSLLVIQKYSENDEHIVQEAAVFVWLLIAKCGYWLL